MEMPPEGEPRRGQPAKGQQTMGEPEMGQPGMGQPEMGQPDTGRPEMGPPYMGKTDARRLALRVALGQAAVALAAAAVSWALAGSRAALSAALGGGISSVASLVMALISFGKEAATDPLRAIRAFFIGEAAKVLVVITLFVAVWKTMKVVPLAMLGAYIATFFVFWIALATGLGAQSRAR